MKDILASLYLIENSLRAGDLNGVDCCLDRLFQVHSGKQIITYTNGIPYGKLKISYTPGLLRPLISERIKNNLDKYR